MQAFILRTDNNVFDFRQEGARIERKQWKQRKPSGANRVPQKEDQRIGGKNSDKFILEGPNAYFWDPKLGFFPLQSIPL